MHVDLTDVPDWTILEAAADRYHDAANLAPGRMDVVERYIRRWAGVTKQRHDEAERTIEDAANALLADREEARPEHVADARDVARTMHRLGYLRRPEPSAAEVIIEDYDPDVILTDRTDDPGTWDADQ